MKPVPGDSKRAVLQLEPAFTGERSLDDTAVAKLGEELYQALRGGYTLAPLTERLPDIRIDDAYQVSQHMLRPRIERDGERVVGKKIGVTSRAVQEMLGVFQPDFGFLTDAMHFADGAEISIPERLIQPRAEAEIAFLLRTGLQGPGVSEKDVLAATECILPCFEIVDSRIRNWEIRIQDTIADNASCGVYVLGEARADPADFELPDLQVKVYKNDRFLSEGRGAAVQGNPLTAVAWLANTLGRYGIPFEAGETILSGSLVPLEPVQVGDRMRLELQGVGEASLNFV